MSDEDFKKQLPGLVKNYQPAAEVKDSIKNVSLLIIVGPSGVGKTSVIDKLGLPFVVVYTTRQPRPGEKDGIDFHFMTNYDQLVNDIKSGQFVQMVVGASGDFYGTKPDSYAPSDWASMPVVADVVPQFRQLGFKQTLSAFIAAPSYEEWMRRIKDHPVTSQQLADRLAEAKRSLTFALQDQDMHFILNDDLDKAVQQTKDLLSGKVDQQREQLARQAAQAMLDGIN